MTNRWRWLAMLAALVGVLAGMESAGTTPASAATYVYICSHQFPSSCLQGEGVGNQMQVATSQQADLKKIQVGTTVNGYPIVEFQNQNDHCVYANGAGQVVLENASCGGKSYEEWRAQPGDSPGTSCYDSYGNGWTCKFQNVDYGGYMYITNTSNYVWEGATTGHYYNWVYQ